MRYPYVSQMILYLDISTNSGEDSYTISKTEKETYC